MSYTSFSLLCDRGGEGENWKAEGGPREERREMERRKGRKVLVGRRQRAKEGYGEMKKKV